VIRPGHSKDNTSPLVNARRSSHGKAVKEEKSIPPSNWISVLRETLASAGSRLDEAREFLDIASRGRDPGIDLVQLAEKLYKARRIRERFFPVYLFVEPTWDLLLDLYVAHHRSRIVITSGACIAAGVPLTTGLRWIEKLDAAGVVERSPSPTDHLLVLISLTAQSLERMDELLREIALLFPFGRLAP
jgi:hypothetical protein